MPWTPAIAVATMGKITTARSVAEQNLLLQPRAKARLKAPPAFDVLVTALPTRPHAA